MSIFMVKSILFCNTSPYSIISISVLFCILEATSFLETFHKIFFTNSHISATHTYKKQEIVFFYSKGCIRFWYYKKKKESVEWDKLILQTKYGITVMLPDLYMIGEDGLGRIIEYRCELHGLQKLSILKIYNYSKMRTRFPLDGGRQGGGGG